MVSEGGSMHTPAEKAGLPGICKGLELGWLSEAFGVVFPFTGCTKCAESRCMRQTGLPSLDNPIHTKGSLHTLKVPGVAGRTRKPVMLCGPHSKTTRFPWPPFSTPLQNPTRFSNRVRNVCRNLNGTLPFVTQLHT
jgi:hypothetical protein